MPKLSIPLIALLCFGFNTLTYAYSLSDSCQSTSCCGGNRGGLSYCDSSAGRYVCRNGEYSNCYCTRHAVMDMQRLAGCCLWHGGVMKTEYNLVVCRDGTQSEECGLENPPPTNPW